MVSDCILHVEYKLSNEEFMSFTRASRSTSSSERQNKGSVTHLEIPDKEVWKDQRLSLHKVTHNFVVIC